MGVVSSQQKGRERERRRERERDQARREDGSRPVFWCSLSCP